MMACVQRMRRGSLGGTRHMEAVVWTHLLLEHLAIMAELQPGKQRGEVLVHSTSHTDDGTTAVRDHKVNKQRGGGFWR